MAKHTDEAETLNLHSSLNNIKVTLGKFISKVNPRMAFSTLAVLFMITAVSGSGISVWTSSNLYAASKNENVTYQKLVASSEEWGSLQLPASKAKQNEKIVTEADRSQFRQLQVTDSSVNPKNYTSSNSPAAKGNDYGFGYCTWYAYNRRIELGLPAGSGWGDAYQWADSARNAGFSVDNKPKAGDIIVMYGPSYLGHVAVVEEVGKGNKIRISEMNAAGWNVHSERWLDNASQYLFVH